MIRRKMMKTTFCFVATLMITTTAYAQGTENETILPINVLTNEAIYKASTVELQPTNFEVKLTDYEPQQVEELAETKEMAELEVKQVSPYANLAMGTAASYVNIRKEPNMDAEIVGKLYEGAVGTIVKEEGDWVYINSDRLKGYVSKEYVAIGEKAEKLFDKYATRVATVNVVTLKVREKNDLESRALTLIPEGSTYQVLKESNKWVKIKLDDYVGYVAREYVDLGWEFEYGISIEEEEQNNAEELAAQLAAQRAEEEANRPSAKPSAKPSNNTSNSNSSNNSNKPAQKPSNNTSKPSTNTSSSSSKGVQIANYAKQFVGNPYVWGGTSLTKGADCSGFTQSVFRKFGYSIPRTSGAQAKAGSRVSVSDMKAGDLIFYAKGGRVNHVALYIGGGKVVHASNPKSGIKISNYNYRSVYAVRRIVK